jgi:hypothetical protein
MFNLVVDEFRTPPATLCFCYSSHTNGDILVWNHVTGRRHELSSMGIRVNAETLRRQLEMSKLLDNLKYPYHQGNHQQSDSALDRRRHRPVAYADAVAAKGALGRSEHHGVAEGAERDVREEEHLRAGVNESYIQAFQGRRQPPRLDLASVTRSMSASMTLQQLTASVGKRQRQFGKCHS